MTYAFIRMLLNWSAELNRMSARIFVLRILIHCTLNDQSSRGKIKNSTNASCGSCMEEDEVASSQHSLLECSAEIKGLVRTLVLIISSR